MRGRWQCFNHLQREAVARCRSCSRSYCRECVTEHAGVLRCANCIGRSEERRPAAVRTLPLPDALLAALILMATWFCLREAAVRVATTPSMFHNGSALSEVLFDP